MKWVKQLFEGADSELKNQNLDSDDLLPASSPN
jgi:hypothetical protein